MASDWLVTLKQMASQIPTFIVILGGLIIALVRWRRHPRASLFLVIGLALMLGIFGGSTFIYQYIIQQSNGGSMPNIQALLETLNWTFNGCHAASLALLVLAAIVGRKSEGVTGFQVTVGTPPPPMPVAR